MKNLSLLIAGVILGICLFLIYYLINKDETVQVNIETRTDAIIDSMGYNQMTLDEQTRFVDSKAKARIRERNK